MKRGAWLCFIQNYNGTLIYIYKNVTVRLCVCAQTLHKMVNLRNLFTDGVAIWIQCCRRIRTFLYTYYIYRLAVPGHALLWPFPVTDWMVSLRSFLDVFVPSRTNNPFTQPIVSLRSRWSSREYDDLSLIFYEALSILACYTTVLYAPI
jgi:hypothetical protein